MALRYPLINGVRHSWAEVEIRVDNTIILGCTKIDYSDKLDPGIVRGAGSNIIAFTTGIQETSGSITFLLEEFQVLVQALQQKNPTWKLVQFPIMVTYDGSASGLSTIQDTIIGARISEVKIGTTEAGSADPMTRECSLFHMGVQWGDALGSPPFPSPNASPISFSTAVGL
jgi:hypothetical protein